ncbi:MAG: pyridoxamine 5'-phosphate oxidase [Sandaracinaceae bacterium]
MTETHDPIATFLAARARAQDAGEPWHATATVLATADEQGQPHARYVLVKEVEPDGLYFNTNYESTKARELSANPRAALCFHFATIGEQYRVEGEVERASVERSEAYFRSRPRESQLGAWASDQSRPLGSRAELEARLSEVRSRFEGQQVPRPPHWGGYRLFPMVVERWVEGDARLHDRFRYTRQGEVWTQARLSP